MNRIRSLTLAGTLVLAAALGSARTAQAQETPAPATPPAAQPQQQRSETAERARAPRRRSDVLTREELMSSGATNLYDAVQRLRPAWFRRYRGPTSVRGSGAGGLVVYQGTTPWGSVDVLRHTNIDFAEELRFLDGPTASNTLPGLGSRIVVGAIVIVRPGQRH
jgi:hypothetical protein